MHYVAAMNALQKENGLTNRLETFHDYTRMNVFAPTLCASDLVERC